MENLIILGSNGMLGNYIKRYFQTQTNYNVICINRNNYDVTIDNIIKLESLLKEYLGHKTLVFNAIGLIPQASKSYQLNDELYIKVNKEFPHQLSNLCHKYGSIMIHPTTDCVYSGKKGNYNENDKHDETNMYGITKSEGEPKNCTVIRTSIIGEEINNKRSLVEWIKSNKEKSANGYINHYWNGITCLQYAKIVHYMLINNLFWKGIRHIYSPITVSKYDILNMVNNIYNLNITINKYETSDIIDKSLSSIYNENNLFNIPELDQQIKEMYQFSSILYE